LTRKFSIHQRQFTIILLVLLALLAISNTSLTLTRGDEDVQSSVIRAYLSLVDVYGKGGEAPDLVAKLNAAINLAEQANIKRENGDAVGAASLDNQAEAEITKVMSEIPAAQQSADQVSSMRTITAVALVPVSVIVSTSAFYIVLRTWRTRERRKLYEMRIIEKETED
jgi:hypothetical protein